MKYLPTNLTAFVIALVMITLLFGIPVVAYLILHDGVSQSNIVYTIGGVMLFALYGLALSVIKVDVTEEDDD